MVTQDHIYEKNDRFERLIFAPFWWDVDLEKFTFCGGQRTWGSSHVKIGEGGGQRMVTQNKPILFHVEPLIKIKLNDQTLCKVGRKEKNRTPTFLHARKLIRCVNFFPWTDRLSVNFIAYLKRKHFQKIIEKSSKSRCNYIWSWVIS